VASDSSRLCPSFALIACACCLSRNSNKPGTIADLLSIVITLPTESHDSRASKRRPGVVAGSGIILRSASVIIASVPALPSRRWRRAYPAMCVVTGSAKPPTSPLARTTRAEITQSFMVPYFTHLRPPDPSAIAPPTVQM